MAIQRDIGTTATGKKVFCGENRQFEFQVWQQGDLTEAELNAAILAGTAVPEDVGLWSFRWVIRPTQTSETLIFEKETGGDGIAVTGTYNSDPDVNTQLVVVTVDDSDTESLAGKKYAHSLKRTDDGSEKILVYGVFQLTRVTARL